MMTCYECWDCREVLEEYDNGTSLIKSRCLRTRLGRFIHGLVRHRVWASGRYFERQYAAADRKEREGGTDGARA